MWIVAGVSGEYPGGMRRHMELHARGLEGHGIRASLFFAEHGLRVRRFRLQARFPGAALLCRLLPRLREDRPDIVNVHSTASPSWIAARLLGLHRARVVVMSYAADERALPRANPLWAWLRWARVALPARVLLPHAAGVWCVNSEDAEFYRASYGVPSARVAVIPHAVEKSFYKDPGVVRDWSQLLFVGTWIPRKGVDVLTKVIAQLLARNPKYGVVLAGTMSEPRDVLRGFPGGVVDRIRVYPLLNDAALRRLYWGSGLLLVPSRLEGLPFSVLEAMAGGCPALASANSGMRDTIEDGKNGWLMPHLDVEAWLERIDGLMADIEGRRRASVEAQTVASRFRLEDVTRRVVDWYEGL